MVDVEVGTYTGSSALIDVVLSSAEVLYSDRVDTVTTQVASSDNYPRPFS